MAAPPVDVQDDYFYGPIWSKELTIFLVDHLCNHVWTGNWVWNAPNTAAIRQVRDHVNETFQQYFTENDVFHHVRFLRTRFQTFERLINCPGVVWDKDNNFVQAEAHIWTRLIQENMRVKAYYHRGEPLYEALKLLFKRPTVEYNIPDFNIGAHVAGSDNGGGTGSISPRTVREVISHVRPNFYTDDSDTDSAA